MEKQTETHEISPEIKDQFEVIKVQPGEVGWKGKIYDLRNITLEQADKLVEEKFPYLKKKVSTSSPAKKDSKVN
jgi:hypothetical protein